ncbi:MAG: glycoside hydrolase family 2 TIM barrel-domain containing protein [Devosia sp.]
MRSILSFNRNWSFEDGQAVVLPHTAVELPFGYFDERAYQRPFTYSKRFDAGADWAGKEVGLVFDGAMANAQVFLNGVEIAAHKDGYTPFSARLTGRLEAFENVITVKIDGSERPDTPPFGGRIDYLTYAGIYRDVWLKLTDPVSIGQVKIETLDVLTARRSVHAMVELDNPQQLEIAGELSARLLDGGGKLVAETKVKAASSCELSLAGLADIALWDIDSPTLYTLELSYGGDTLATRFGFRSAEFTDQGFLLNGRKLKLRGLNRHQSYPYAGYGLGRSAQEQDAEILKHQLHVNIVRTSHYPQSPWFLDHCDRIGLLVFEEIPGWQHIGGAAWKAEAVENVRRMIRRDWNHPSIIIWGVRINESLDDHDFYAETNRVAQELDSTRQTGGVRYLTESELLEDVYTMNDFILGMEELGGNRPRTALRPLSETTGLPTPVPYMITEFGGHMYPTKIYDQEQRQVEHVRRHLEVLDAAYGNTGISGAIGWCAFDYNTHKDFGSGDRICHHGVMDMFREPKFAAFAYASQCEPSEEVIMRPVTFWARGERNIGGVLPLMVLTNCDEVELRYGGRLVKRLAPDRGSFPNLPHPPVAFERSHFTEDELGQWGSEWDNAEIVGFVGGRPATTVRFAADPVLTKLEVVADRDTLDASERDCVRVMVRALDQAGQKLPFLFEPVEVEIDGPADLVGPKLLSLRGGATGFWIATKPGMTGTIDLTVRTDRLGEQRLSFKAR